MKWYERPFSTTIGIMTIIAAAGVITYAALVLFFW